MTLAGQMPMILVMESKTTPPLLDYVAEHYCAECGAHTDDAGPFDNVNRDTDEPICDGCTPCAEDVADRDYDPSEAIR